MPYVKKKDKNVRHKLCQRFSVSTYNRKHCYASSSIFHKLWCEVWCQVNIKATSKWRFILMHVSDLTNAHIQTVFLLFLNTYICKKKNKAQRNSNTKHLPKNLKNKVINLQFIIFFIFTFFQTSQSLFLICTFDLVIHNTSKNVDRIHFNIKECFSNFTKINTPKWVFFMFFKLYKWYQIAQRITYF